MIIYYSYFLFLFQLNGSTYKGVIKISLGGVGRNLSDCLTRLNHDPLFISVVGDDPNGNSIINHNSQMVSQKFVLIKKSFLQRDSYKKRYFFTWNYFP